MRISRARAGSRILAWILCATAGCATGGAPDDGLDAGAVVPRVDAAADDAPVVADSGAGACESDADCDDGDACTGVETCIAGTCSPGLAVACDDGVECTSDACDPATGACASTPDDARCTGGMICDPVDGCETPVACESDAECDDSIFCNGVETCDPTTGCRGSMPPVCDDGVACTVDACDAAMDACASAPSDAACDDGTACNGTERCDPIAGCGPGIAVTCNDGIACTADACVEPAGTCASVAPDADGDGHVVAGCLSGDDCDDLAPAIHPGATELCNGVDDDCSGAPDDGPGLACAMGSAPRACTTSCGTPGSQPCTAACTLGACLASAEVCGNGCDDDGNGAADDGCGPPNDQCTGAIALSTAGTSTTVTGSTVGATNQSGCGSGGDVYYSFSLAQREVVYLDTQGSAYDTQVGIATACSGNVGCNDDSCGTLQSQLVQVLGPGAYYVVVSGFGGSTGSFTLRFQHLPTGNGTPVVITPGSGLTVSGTTSGAGALTSTCGSASGPEIMYYYSSCPTYAGGAVSATTCSRASWDTQLYFRDAAAGTQSCNDDACGLQSTVGATASAGAGLRALYVDGFGGAGGAFSVQYTIP